GGVGVGVDGGGGPLGARRGGGLSGPVAGPAAGAVGGVAIWAPPRPDRGARRDVHDRAGSARNHRGERELAQDEGRVKVDGPRAQPFVLSQLRSEEHTSELQSLTNLVCRLLLEKKKSRPATRAPP